MYFWQASYLLHIINFFLFQFFKRLQSLVLVALVSLVFVLFWFGFGSVALGQTDIITTQMTLFLRQAPSLKSLRAKGGGYSLLQLRQPANAHGSHFRQNQEFTPLA